MNVTLDDLIYWAQRTRGELLRGRSGNGTKDLIAALHEALCFTYDLIAVTAEIDSELLFLRPREAKLVREFQKGSGYDLKKDSYSDDRERITGDEDHQYGVNDLDVFDIRNAFMKIGWIENFNHSSQDIILIGSDRHRNKSTLVLNYAKWLTEYLGGTKTISDLISSHNQSGSSMSTDSPSCASGGSGYQAQKQYYRSSIVPRIGDNEHEALLTRGLLGDYRKQFYERMDSNDIVANDFDLLFMVKEDGWFWSFSQQQIIFLSEKYAKAPTDSLQFDNVLGGFKLTTGGIINYLERSGLPVLKIDSVSSESFICSEGAYFLENSPDDLKRAYELIEGFIIGSSSDSYLYAPISMDGSTGAESGSHVAIFFLPEDSDTTKRNRLISSLLHEWRLSSSMVATAARIAKEIERPHKIRNARAAVLARNFSHIIGSHVLSNPHFSISLLSRSWDLRKAEELFEESGSEFTDARFAFRGERPGSKKRQEAWETGQSTLKKVEGKILSERAPVIHFHRFLQGRFDFIARAVEDVHDRPEPVFWVSDVIDGFRRQMAYLNTLVSDLGLSLPQMEIHLHFDHPEGKEKGELTFRGGWNDRLVFNKWRIGTCCGYKGYPDPYKLSTLVGLPGGMTTAHAFYALLENIIRNSVKYGTHRKYTRSDAEKANDGESDSPKIVADNLKPYHLHIRLAKEGDAFDLQIWDNYSGAQDIDNFSLRIVNTEADWDGVKDTLDLTEGSEREVLVGFFDDQLTVRAIAKKEKGTGKEEVEEVFPCWNCSGKDGVEEKLAEMAKAQLRELAKQNGGDNDNSDQIKREILRIVTSLPDFPQGLYDSMVSKVNQELITDTGELNRKALGMQEMRICADYLSEHPGKVKSGDENEDKPLLKIVKSKDIRKRQQESKAEIDHPHFIPLTYQIPLEKPLLLAVWNGEITNGQNGSDYIKSFSSDENNTWESLINAGAHLLVINGTKDEEKRKELVEKIAADHTVLPYRILILCPACEKSNANGSDDTSCADAWRKILNKSAVPHRRVQIYSEDGQCKQIQGKYGGLWKELFGSSAPNKDGFDQQDYDEKLVIRCRQAWLRAWKPIQSGKTWDLWIGMERDADQVKAAWREVTEKFEDDLVWIGVKAFKKGDKTHPLHQSAERPQDTDYWKNESTAKHCHKRALVFDNHGDCFREMRDHCEAMDFRKWSRFYQENGLQNDDLYQTLAIPPASPFGFAFYIYNLVESCLAEVAVVDERLISDIAFNETSSTANPGFGKNLQNHQRAAVWPVFTLKRDKSQTRGFYTSKQKEVVRQLVSGALGCSEKGDEMLREEGVYLVRDEDKSKNGDSDVTAAKFLVAKPASGDGGREFELISGGCKEARNDKCIAALGCDGIALDAIIIHEGTLDLVNKDPEVKWDEDKDKGGLNKNMEALWKLAPTVIRTSGRGRDTKHFPNEVPFAEFNEISGAILTSHNKYALTRAILGTSGSRKKGGS